ncbi:MAG: nuclear transport factor 2 family protein [Aeromicrobium sp.]
MTSSPTTTPTLSTEQHRHPAAFSDVAALPEAATADVLDVRQVLALLGHAIDNHAWDELGALLAPDVELLVGGTTLTGREAVVEWFADRTDPPAHHTVNTVVRVVGDDVVAWSRLVTITGDGRVASADALDRFVRSDDGWVVARRGIHPRHGGEHPGDEAFHAWLA